MEAQTWKHFPFRYRDPNAADLTLAAVVWYLLHIQPQVPEVIAGIAAFLVLRCVSYDRPAGKRR
ncbi:hypothetical protein AB0A81_39650 [Streptomyces flaveolus]|uniref:Uncharacterized protein n=1 Tax=Streptomyces flaveolus TaxID=67297 RepID=A0ABV1VCN0_9ACTN